MSIKNSRFKIDWVLINELAIGLKAKERKVFINAKRS